MTRAYSVYVLYSEKFHRTYAGQTNDIYERIKRHNKGLVNSTKPFKPWDVVYTEKCQTRSDAMRREKWLKSGKGRAFVKTLIASA
jgi:putative endonuclease